jgi:hypothetical protein
VRSTVQYEKFSESLDDEHSRNIPVEVLRKYPKNSTILASRLAGHTEVTFSIELLCGIRLANFDHSIIKHQTQNRCLDQPAQMTSVHVMAASELPLATKKPAPAIAGEIKTQSFSIRYSSFFTTLHRRRPGRSDL